MLTTFKVGKSAIDNWNIIKAADKNYWWLHAENIPSAHIIIEIDVMPTKEEIEYACELCKIQTKIKHDVPYIMTPISNLKLGSKPGEVIFRDTKRCIIV